MEREYENKGIKGNMVNPCLTCGACCAFYRVSFYWRERGDFQADGVPEELCEDLTQFRCVMKGTNQPHPRCIALLGTIGKHVLCKIYNRRPAVCREIEPSYKNGYPEIKCDKARLAYGLPPLTPDIWKTKPEDSNSSPNLFPLSA